MREKMVHLNEVDELMNQLMEVSIFGECEKRQLLCDDDKVLLDPNLLMDTRHKLHRESLSVSASKSLLLAEAERLLSKEEKEELRRKKEREYLARELKKFEKEVYKARPRFHEPVVCNRKNIASSDDEVFWRSCSKKSANFSIEKRRPVVSTNNSQELGVNEPSESSCLEEIRVTIKDKPAIISEEDRLVLLKFYFEGLKQHAMEKRRLRDIQTKLQIVNASKILRKYLKTWRINVEKAKNLRKLRKNEMEISNERKIEIFINAIAEKQKQLAKSRQSTSDGSNFTAKESNFPVKENHVDRREKILNKRIVVESPAENRLKAQRKIIEEQKMKLAEQNRIINELKMKQVQEEMEKSGNKTVTAAKDILQHCGRQTRRNLIQLMRQEGYRDKSLVEEPKLPNPPKFLLRMEARADARKERMKRLEEERRKKWEEEKRKEEAARREEEEERRRLQREALREARKLREEYEHELEKSKKRNEIADQFYRKYLLRRYIWNSFSTLIREKNNRMQAAVEHYRTSLLRSIFGAWKKEVDEQNRIKTELAMSTYHRNLLCCMFKNWQDMVNKQKLKCQVAKDLYDFRIQEKIFKSWRQNAAELKTERVIAETRAQEHYERILRKRSFDTWKKYMLVADEIKESEEMRDKWREIVQEVIPDFNPKQRGVAIDD